MKELYQCGECYSRDLATSPDPVFILTSPKPFAFIGGKQTPVEGEGAINVTFISLINTYVSFLILFLRSC